MTALGSFEIFLLGLIGCSAIVCGTFLRWGWHERRQVLARQGGDAPMSSSMSSPMSPPPILNLARLAFFSTTVDAAVEIRDALMTVDVEAARHRVRLEMAVEPDLALRPNPGSLRPGLAALVGPAI